jgi:glycosyltransferase involved in cell wall biosynthesis
VTNPKVSIVIRALNEERWISSCLKAVFAQSFKDFEVILVDNRSTDGTVAKAQRWPVRVISLDNYFPGRNLNEGVQASSAEILVSLSAHCEPTGQRWLESLIAPLQEETVAGVYGRQEPLNFTSPEDKRDLLIAFGLDRKRQRRDPFFHNANSAFRRDVWERFPFSEEVTNIEDRLWARTVQSHGYEIFYQPEASVYHYHGIHQHGNTSRAHSTMTVLESAQNEHEEYSPGRVDPCNLDIAAFIPARGAVERNSRQEELLRATVETALSSSLIRNAYVLTDAATTAELSAEWGAEVPFLREPDDSSDDVTIGAVYKRFLERLEGIGRHPDVVISLEPHYPNRDKEVVERCIHLLSESGFDSVMPAWPEYRACYIYDGKKPKRIDEGEVPRPRKSPLLVGLRGFCCAAFADVIRSGLLTGVNAGFVIVSDASLVLEEHLENPPQESASEFPWQSPELGAIYAKG